MRGLLSIILEYFSNNKKVLLLYFILGLSAPIINVVLPHYYGKLLAEIKKSKSFYDIRNLFIQAIGLWLLAQILYSSMDRIDQVVLPRLQAYVRNKLIDAFIDNTRYTTQEINMGDVISKLLKVPIIVKEIFTQLRYVFLPAGMTVLFAVGYFYYVEWKLGFLSSLLIVLGGLLIYQQSKQSLTTSCDADTSQNELYEEIADILANVSSIHTACTTEQEKQYIEAKTQQNIQDFSNVIHSTGKIKLLFNTYYIILMTCIVGYSVYLSRTEQISTDSVASIIIIVLYLINQLSQVSGEIRDFFVNLGVVKMIDQTLDTIEQTNKQFDTADMVTLKDAGDSIQFDSVWFKYPDTETYILRNFCLSIPSKQKICIRGKIGTGKTTFIDLLLRFKTPTKGSIFIDNVPIHTMNILHLRRNIGYIPQETRLFNRTILENITYGTDKTRHDVEGIMKKYNIELPDLNRMAGKYGESLSGGQKQLIHLLRCLMKDTPVLILDEPTASVDWETKQYILSIIHNTEKTMIVVSHDPDVMSCCDTIIDSHDFLQ